MSFGGLGRGKVGLILANLEVLAGRLTTGRRKKAVSIASYLWFYVLCTGASQNTSSEWDGRALEAASSLRIKLPRGSHWSIGHIQDRQQTVDRRIHVPAINVVRLLQELKLPGFGDECRRD